MPTYAYACKDCGNRFDAVQSFTDDALTECPACGGAVRKQYGSIGVTFNGSGFYRTDSRPGEKPASDSGSGSGSGDKGGASSATPSGGSGSSTSSSSQGAASASSS